MAARKGQPTGPAGTIVRASGKDGPQLIRSKGRRWTDAAEARFLDALSASCNVAYALAEVGFAHSAVYRRRRRDPAFAARWDAALAQGYHRLEALLLQRATETLQGFEPNPDTPMPDVGFRDALHLLQHHRAAVTGTTAKGKTRARVRSFEEVKAAIITKLEAIEAARIAAGEAPYHAPTKDERDGA